MRLSSVEGRAGGGGPLQVADAAETRRVVKAAVDGDRAAFDLLYHRYHRAVHGVVLSRMPPGDAEDLVQEVFLEGWRSLEQLRDGAAFGGWICAIARRRAIDWLRSRRVSEPLTTELSVEPDAARKLEAQRALQAIQSLDEAYRETLVLRLVGGLSGNEIAAITGLTPGSVRVNLHRGMKLLRERIGGDDGTQRRDAAGRL
jgi:RNA polymerase sigma-70 factor, ECF subfamily